MASCKDWLTMKAAYIERFGGPEVLTYGDLPDPVAGPGQIVIDTVAASVNGADPKVCAGDYAQAKFPVILGRDFSGVVGAAGAGVQDLRVGDEVFGVLEAGRDGTYCEKIAVGAAIVAKKPVGLSHVEAAALGLTGLTALCSVEDSLKLRSGRAAFIASGAQAPKPERSDVTALRPAVPRDRPHLERIAELCRIGAVRPPEVTLFELPKARQALGVSAARHFKGKLVL